MFVKIINLVHIYINMSILTVERKYPVKTQFTKLSIKSHRATYFAEKSIDIPFDKTDNMCYTI